MREYVEHDGVRYYRSKSHQYLHSSKGGFLHRRVYEDAHGPIPTGYDVHHIDFNHENNDPSNLVALPRDEHHRLHMAQRPEHMERMWDASRKSWAEYEGRVEVCSDCGVEFHHRRRVDLDRCPECNANRRAEKYQDDGRFVVDTRCVVCEEEFAAQRYYRDGKISDDHVKTCSRSCTAKLAYQNRAEEQDYYTMGAAVKRYWAEKPDNLGICVDCRGEFTYRAQRKIERCKPCQRDRQRIRQNERRRQRREAARDS